MSAVKDGDKVKVHYKGYLDEGFVFDTSEERDPLEFTVGAGQVIPGFEKGVIGMILGDKKTIHIPCVEAYGDRYEELVMRVPISEFEGKIPEIGTAFQIPVGQDQTAIMRVVEINDKEVILDANSPLAGKDLNFDLELMSIN